MAAAVTLLSAVTATGPGAAKPIQVGGDYMFAVNGTFGGTSVALEMLGPDGSNYISLGASATFAVAGLCLVTIPPGTYRATVTGGAGMTISATLKAIS